MFATAFPAGKAGVDWGCMAEAVSENEQLCIRAFGGCDDLEVSVNVFLSAPSLQAMNHLLP
jgi:hypothetical protein